MTSEKMSLTSKKQGSRRKTQESMAIFTENNNDCNPTQRFILESNFFPLHPFCGLCIWKQGNNEIKRRLFTRGKRVWPTSRAINGVRENELSLVH